MAIKLPAHSPKSQLWLQRGDCKEHLSTLQRGITDHPFNHAMEIVIPGVDQLPPEVSSLPPPSYFTATLPVSHFVQPDILQRYLLMNEGSFTALALGRRIDIDDVFAVLPSGKLIFSVVKDTYEQLGLQGNPSRYQKQHRYVIEVDLKAAHFKPGKANYERVRKCLTERLHQKEVDFIITWTGHGTNSSTEEKFLEDFRATKTNCEVTRELLQDFSLPLLDSEHPYGRSKGAEDLSCSAVDLHSWVGAVALGLDVYDGAAPDDYVSTFVPPEPHSVCRNGLRSRWTGMMSSKYVCDLIGVLQNYLTSHTDIPWVGVTVWGFEDSPVSWRTNEHGWMVSGDNHSTIVLFPGSQYWYLQTLATHDVIQ